MSSGILLYLALQNVASAENSFNLNQYTIEISGFAFVPKQLEVKTGDTITWINKDIVPHNILESIDQRIISPELGPGERYTFVVKESMLYHCELHPLMKGKLLLTPVP
jgi:plastocyanin